MNAILLKMLASTEIQEGALLPVIRERAREEFAASGFRRRDLRCLTEAALPEGPVAPAIPAVNGQAAGDRLRKVLGRVADHVMAIEVAAQYGATFGSRGNGRTDRRNGFRSRTWQSMLGPIELKVPRLRRGSYVPGFFAAPALCLEDIEAVAQSTDSGALERLLRSMSGAISGDDAVTTLGSEIRRLVGETAPNSVMQFRAGLGGLAVTLRRRTRPHQRRGGGVDGLRQHLPAGATCGG